MKYLVTGGSGFLGNYILKQLLATGENIFLTTRKPTQPNHIKADLESGIFDKLQVPVDYVIHAAGKAHIVPKTQAEKKSFSDINVEGTKLLLRRLEESGELPKGIVFISSVSVYGAEKGAEISEEAPLNAIDPYGISKIEAEKVLLDWGILNKVTIGIARLPLIAGINAPGNLQSMINGIKSGRYFRIGAGNARKSMVWAGDIAQMIPVLATKGGIYNFTDGYHPNFAELEDAITAHLKVNGVKTLPFTLANLAATMGTIVEKVVGKRMPINQNMLKKITSTLTFSDQKARKELNWHPSGVLSHIKEMVS